MRANELANCAAPLVGAVVAAVLVAVPDVVAARLVRELEVVEVRDCELNVVLRDVGTPVPNELLETTEVIEELDEEVKVDVPEKEMLDDPVPPMTAKGPE
jgi:hypothetical protein